MRGIQRIDVTADQRCQNLLLFPRARSSGRGAASPTIGRGSSFPPYGDQLPALSDAPSTLPFTIAATCRPLPPLNPPSRSAVPPSGSIYKATKTSPRCFHSPPSLHSQTTGDALSSATRVAGVESEYSRRDGQLFRPRAPYGQSP